MKVAVFIPLEAIKEMNGSEAEERKAVESTQFAALQQMRQQHDKLIDMASKELIRDDVFKEKSKSLLAQIQDMEDNIANTNSRAASWREGMHKTIDVIAHGRERFENGDIAAKRDVLLALGSNPTIHDGKVELTPFEWLLPIENGYPELAAAYEKVRTSNFASPEEKTIAYTRIYNSWLGR